MPSVKRAAVAAVAAALLLAGCTGSGKPKTADPASSTAASDSPSPTASPASSDPASSSPAEGSSAPSTEAASPTNSSQSSSAESSATESSAAPSPTASAPVPAGPNAKFAGDPIAQSLLQYLVAREHALRAYDAAYQPMRALGTALRHQLDTDTIRMLKEKQLALKGRGYYVVEKVRRLRDDEALVYMCEQDDQGWLVHAISGAVAFPVSKRWLRHQIRMVRDAGLWKVDTGVAGGKFSCTAKLLP